MTQAIAASLKPREVCIKLLAINYYLESYAPILEQARYRKIIEEREALLSLLESWQNRQMAENTFDSMLKERLYDVTLQDMLTCPQAIA